MPFQNRINIDLAPGVHGDFASTNPRITLIGTEAAWAAAAGGLAAGSFVWVNENTRQAYNSATGAGAAATAQPDGFIRRDMLGWVGVGSTGANGTNMLVPAGNPVTVYENGEFWVTLPAGVTATRKGAVSVDAGTGLIAESGVATGYYYAESGNPGDTVKISSWLRAGAAT